MTACCIKPEFERNRKIEKLITVDIGIVSFFPPVVLNVQLYMINLQSF